GGAGGRRPPVTAGAHRRRGAGVWAAEGLVQRRGARRNRVGRAGGRGNRLCRIRDRDARRRSGCRGGGGGGARRGARGWQLDRRRRPADARLGVAIGPFRDGRPRSQGGAGRTLLQMGRTSFLIATAVGEGGIGLLLLIWPPVPLALLLGVEQASTEAVLLARVAGAALLALGITCWAGRND